jgi:Raf kinase inhibitor-like YbhB/YbcL family protein
MRRWLCFSLALLLSACARAAEPGSSATSFQLNTPAFAEGATIPVDYTCDGQDRSPELNWQTPPANTQSFVLIMDDPDAPGGTFTHWVLFDLPRTTRQLSAGSGAIGVAGQNSFGSIGYRGPCPPPGGAHHYFFKLYALDVASLNLKGGATRNDVEAALNGHIIGQAQLSGKYERK